MSTSQEKERRPGTIRLSRELKELHPTWSKAKCEAEAKKIRTEQYRNGQNKS